MRLICGCAICWGSWFIVILLKISITVISILPINKFSHLDWVYVILFISDSLLLTHISVKSVSTLRLRLVFIIKLMLFIHVFIIDIKFILLRIHIILALHVIAFIVVILVYFILVVHLSFISILLLISSILAHRISILAVVLKSGIFIVCIVIVLVLIVIFILNALLEHIHITNCTNYVLIIIFLIKELLIFVLNVSFSIRVLSILLRVTHTFRMISFIIIGLTHYS